MDAIVWIAEQKIKEATEAGELSDLPGKGHPLKVDDNYWRGDFANHVLKNAGLLPRPLALRKRIEECQQSCFDLLEQCRSSVYRNENRGTRFLRDCRRQYKHVLKETNNCIEELAHYHIQQEVRHNHSLLWHSTLSLLDVERRLDEFDSEFSYEEHL